MATTSIGSGKTHTDIDAWEIATDNDLVTAAEGEIGEIQSNEDFGNKNVVFTGATTNVTFFRKLTVASANRHNGVEGTGHARIYTDQAGHVFEINEDFFFLEYPDIELFVTCAASDEAVRISQNIKGVIISKGLIHYAGSVAQTDGIFMNERSNTTEVSTAFLDNLFIYGFDRAGIHFQNLNNGGTLTMDMDFLSIFNCGTADSNLKHGGVVLEVGTSGTNNGKVFNCAGFHGVVSPGKTQDYQLLEDGGTNNYSGNDNIASDTSAEGNFTASFDSVVLVETSPASGENFQVVDDDSPFNFKIGGENSFTKSQEGNGSRIGSEPDSRQDFGTDLVGRSRTGGPASITIGAYQFVLAAGGLSIPVAMHNYRRRRS